MSSRAGRRLQVFGLCVMLAGIHASSCERAPVAGERATDGTAAEATTVRAQAPAEANDHADSAPAAPPPPFEPLAVTLASTYSKDLPPTERQDAWTRLAPEVRRVRVVSSLDASEQPALFYASDSARDKPLLVVLHSWSATHLQDLNIPYARYAIAQDWAFIHPNFRGTNSRPEATASDLAVQDVVDAVRYAQRHARVDAKRIYLTGYSGGGMMALTMAGRHPELWAAVVAWGSVVDLVDWYVHNRKRGHMRYAREIAASCGGSPRSDARAGAECRRRSPSAVLSGAKGAPFPIYIAHGVEDRTVQPSHALRAFNLLADPADRFTDAQVRFIATRYKLPRRLRDAPPDPLFRAAGVPLLLERKSNNATLALFAGGHDVVYNAGLRWLSAHAR